MALEIPREDAESIETIQRFTPAVLEQLIAALKEAPPISDPKGMQKHISKKVPSLTQEKLTLVLEKLYSLYYIRELSGVDPSRFLDDLVDGIRNSTDLATKQKDINRIRSVFQRLLCIETLSTISKAARLQRDGERLYCSSKIMSDIRPVFGPEATAKPIGAVLTHTLKIGYHQGSEHKEFHVILDSNDLTELEKLVRRAEAKDRTLRELLRTADLPTLDN